jgi:hypothetical protein
MKIYFAYGSNLWLEQMRRRCPDARPLGSFWLAHSRLVFRGVADCPYAENCKIPGGLYLITPDDEKALDLFETAYEKEYVPLSGCKHGDQMMLYVCKSRGIFPPTEEYLEKIVQGYRDFRLPLDPLKVAVEHAHKNYSPSHIERQRYARHGRPRLAEPNSVPVKGRKQTGSPNTGNLFRLN